MPTFSFLSAMLELARADGQPLTAPSPWSWTEWQEFAGCTPPWVDEATTASTGLSANDLQALKAFVRIYHSEDDEKERIKLSQKPKENNKLGCQVLRDWLRARCKEWEFQKVVENILEEQGFSMYEMASDDGLTVSLVAVLNGILISKTSSAHEHGRGGRLQVLQQYCHALFRECCFPHSKCTQRRGPSVGGHDSCSHMASVARYLEASSYGLEDIVQQSRRSIRW